MLVKLIEEKWNDIAEEMLAYSKGLISEKYNVKNNEIIIPMEKIHSTKLNDKIQINKNKGEKDD